MPSYNSALALGSYAPLLLKYLLLLKINLASGVWCLASLPPLAKGAER